MDIRKKKKLLTVLAGGGATPWWAVDGIGASCVGAYKPLSASSLADSYVNLANPGMNDLSLGVAPLFDDKVGWAFNGSTMYLRTGIIPPDDQSYSAFVQFAQVSDTQKIMFGTVNTDAFQIAPNYSNQIVYSNGASLTIATGVTSGKLAFAGTKAYRNGTQEAGDIGAPAGAFGGEIYIGGRNSSGSPTGLEAVWIQAISFYDTPLTEAQVQAIGAALTKEPCHLAITFDDGLFSTYDKALPIMQAAGITATCYVTTDWVGTEVSGVQIATWEQLQALDAAGWSIGNHTKTHANLTTLTQAQIEAELTDAKTALDSNSLSGASDHVAYPFGAHNATVSAAMTAAGMLTGRGGASGDVPKLATVNPYILNMYAMNSGISLATLKAQVLSSIANDKFLIVLFHGIVDSAPASGDWLTSDFQAFIDWLVENDISTMNINEINPLLF